MRVLWPLQLLKDVDHTPQILTYEPLRFDLKVLNEGKKVGNLKITPEVWHTDTSLVTYYLLIQFTLLTVSL